MVEDTVQEQSVRKEVEFLSESSDSGKKDIEQPKIGQGGGAVQIALCMQHLYGGSKSKSATRSTPEPLEGWAKASKGAVVSDVSLEIQRIGKDWEAMGNIDEVEQAECECCGLNEECTQQYIRKTKDCYSGKWVCGLCSEAVKETLVREPRRSIEEALRNQREFCQEFHSSRLNPELSLTCAMRKIAKTSCEHRKYNTSST